MRYYFEEFKESMIKLMMPPNAVFHCFVLVLLTERILTKTSCFLYRSNKLDGWVKGKFLLAW